MMSRYLSLVLAKTIEPTVRWTEALQILVAAIVPAVYRPIGAPMPDGAEVMALAYAGYAVVSFLLFRLVFAAPYLLWRANEGEIDRLKGEIGSPRRRARQAIEARLIDDRIALWQFVTSHRLDDAVLREDTYHIGDYPEFFAPASRLFADDPKLDLLLAEYDAAHRDALEALRSLRHAVDDPEKSAEEFSALEDACVATRAPYREARKRLQDYLLLKH